MEMLKILVICAFVGLVFILIRLSKKKSKPSENTSPTDGCVTFSKFEETEHLLVFNTHFPNGKVENCWIEKRGKSDYYAYAYSYKNDENLGSQLCLKALHEYKILLAKSKI